MKLQKVLVGIVGAALLASGLDSKADRLRLTLDNLSGGGSPSSIIQHKSGASEGLDGFDSPNITQTLNIYSLSYVNLAWNALPTGSLTRVTNVVENNSPSPVSANLRTSVTTENGEFIGKVLNLDVYALSNGIPVFQGTYDARTTTNGNTVPLTINPGHSYNIVFRPEILNTPPTAANSTASGPKDGVLTGWFAVSDSDGVVTNVYVLSPPGGFTVNGTNWIYSPQGFIGTNTVPFYAVDNMGARSTTNTLYLATTNNPNLNQAVITSFTVGSGTATLDALASPGYEHVLLSGTSLTGFGPVATNVIPYLGTNDMQPTSFSISATSNSMFYRLNSR